jgi:hypothetical protein
MSGGDCSEKTCKSTKEEIHRKRHQQSNLAQKRIEKSVSTIETVGWVVQQNAHDKKAAIGCFVHAVHFKREMAIVHIVLAGSNHVSRWIQGVTHPWKWNWRNWYFLPLYTTKLLGPIALPATSI